MLNASASFSGDLRGSIYKYRTTYLFFSSLEYLGRSELSPTYFRKGGFFYLVHVIALDYYTLQEIALAPQTPFWSLGEKALFPSVVRGVLVECFEDLLGPALCEEIRGNDARGADCGAVEI